MSKYVDVPMPTVAAGEKKSFRGCFKIPEIRNCTDENKNSLDDLKDWRSDLPYGVKNNYKWHWPLVYNGKTMKITYFARVRVRHETSDKEDKGRIIDIPIQVHPCSIKELKRN